MLDRFVSYLLRGLTVVLPIAATLWGLRYVFLVIDGWVMPGTPEHPRVLGLGFLIIVVAATLIGVLADHGPTRGMVTALERGLVRIPFIRLVYGTMKDLVDAVLGRKKRFDKPVLVSLGAGLDADIIGFVTAEDLSMFGLRDKVAVYFPQSYNWGGNILILPRGRLTQLEADSATVMTFIVSGGVTGPAGRPASQRSLRFTRRTSPA